MVSLQKIKPENRLAVFLGQVKEYCGLSNEDLSDLMQERFDGDAKKISIGALTKLMDRLNISLDTVMSNKVDFHVLAKNLYGQGRILPAMYTSGQKSSKRLTSAYMVDFIRKSWGENAVTGVMRRFQLHSELLINHDERNNLLLPIDICHHVSQFYGLEAVEEMGGHSVEVMKDKLEATGLMKVRNFNDFIAKFFYDIIPSQVEKNYEWQILYMDTHEAIVKGSLASSVADTYSASIICSGATERNRLGFMKKMVENYLGESPRVELMQSISKGNSGDYYKIQVGTTVPTWTNQ